jgi:hypothetical protein
MTRTAQTEMAPKSTADLIEEIARQVEGLVYYSHKIEVERDPVEQAHFANVRHRMLLSLKEMTDAAIQNSDETGGF